MNPIAIFILGFLVCAALVGAVLAVVHFVDQIIDRKLKVVISELRREIQEVEPPPRPDAKKNIEKNSDDAYNQSDARDDDISDAREPFWNSKEKITEALERAEKGDFDFFGQFAELSGATPIENWRMLDERMVELQETTQDLSSV